MLAEGERRNGHNYLAKGYRIFYFRKCGVCGAFASVFIYNVMVYPSFHLMVQYVFIFEAMGYG